MLKILLSARVGVNAVMALAAVTTPISGVIYGDNSAIIAIITVSFF